jgi:hypothetical protein
MIRQICFSLEESATRPGKYILVPNWDALHIEQTEGSGAVMGARLMGLTFAQYLRFCRDICHAEVVGKGRLYPKVYFDKNEETVSFVKLLNGRATLVLDDLAKREAAQ